MADSRAKVIACGGLLLIASVPAPAQEMFSEVRNIEKVEVTGSNVKRPAIETALPIQVVTREDIERSGAVTAVEVLNQVPANLVGRTDAIFVGNPTAGLSSANLRGLGEASTLVLLNGRRAANYAANGAAVNLNFIPVAAIERVEVLKDGASAIYGADAVAGVINFILRKDFSGVHLSGYGTATQHGGGNQQQVWVTAGYGDLTTQRFNAFVTASYQNNQALPARDREFSRTAYRPDEYINGGPQREATFPANIRHGLTLLNPAYATGCLPPVSIPLQGTGMCVYDQLAVINLIPPVERTNVLGGATWQVDANHEVFAQYLYSYDHYTLVRNVVPVSELVTPDRRPLIYPYGGPFYPTEFATAHGITGDLNLYYRPYPLGPIEDKLQTTAQHAVAGAQGLVASWNYSVAAIYSENRQRYSLVNGVFSEQRLLDAMATGLVNPFGPSGPTGDALLAGAMVSGEGFQNKAVTSSLEAKASKDIYDLPGGSVALALGIEMRRERLDAFQPSMAGPTDLLGAQGPQTTTGSRSVNAVFAELNAPITKNLEAQLAVRYDHYSDFGGTTNPKVAVRWQPDSTWLLRSSYGTGFRAPTLPDLATPLSMRFTGRLSDPRRCPVTRQPSDCGGFAVTYGGNPNLQPEKSTQWNVGVVWEPIPGLSASVDYWSIDRSQSIGALTDNQIFAYFDLFEPTHVVRGPIDPAFPTLPGPIVRVLEINENLGDLQTSGVDVTLNYRSPVTSGGRFAFNLNGTYVADWQQQLDGVHYVTGVGRNVVGAIPRWRHYATLGWSYGPWGATLAQTFSSGYSEVNSSEPRNERTVGSYDVWNVQGSYSGFRNTTVVAGIKNLFDRAPPFSNQTAQGVVMFDPRYADPRGRVFYAQITVAFQ